MKSHWFNEDFRNLQSKVAKYYKKTKRTPSVYDARKFQFINKRSKNTGKFSKQKAWRDFVSGTKNENKMAQLLLSIDFEINFDREKVNARTTAANSQIVLLLFFGGEESPFSDKDIFLFSLTICFSFSLFTSPFLFFFLSSLLSFFSPFHQFKIHRMKNALFDI